MGLSESNGVKENLRGLLKSFLGARIETPLLGALQSSGPAGRLGAQPPARPGALDPDSIFHVVWLASLFSFLMPRFLICKVEPPEALFLGLLCVATL